MTEAARATTSLGRLRGTADRGVARFLGIPYAAPPVGARRFEPPNEPDAWSGVRDATCFGPAPPQAVDELSLRLGLLGAHEQSEDCLTLNVFRPASEAREPRPVMVWIHGGAFASGSGAGPVYDGARLAAEQGVVVVTLNYRVGALGFLALGAPNRGLQDQVAALRFVHREIAAFGGDPENVTVFGESAGAGSIVALLAMPSSAGLFHKAIIQSAAPEGMLGKDEAEARAALVAEELGVRPGDVEAHLAVDADALVAAQARCQEPGPRRIGMFFAPVVDGEVLPEAPMQAVAEGRAHRVPLVLSTTAQEMQLYHLSQAFPEIPDALLPRVIGSRLPGPADDALACAERLAARYTDPESGLEGRDRFFAAETDASLFVPATRLAAHHAVYVPETWMARFCVRSPMAQGRLGACHALDVPFTLGTEDRVPEFAGTGPAAERVGRSLRAAWGAFARTADPACEDIGRWPRYEATRRATLFLEDPCRVVEAPDEDTRRAWAAARRDPELA